MFRRFIKNKRGSALPLALIGILAISVLGMASMRTSESDTSQVVREERSKQAYYMARSGLEIMEKYIVDAR